MGYYVNPKDKSKEEWLEENKSGPALFVAQLHDLTPNPELDDGLFRGIWNEMLKSGDIPVVLVNNGAFSAAGVAYCLNELEAFTARSDKRHRVIFQIPKDRLIEVCPEVKTQLDQLTIGDPDHGKR